MSALLEAERISFEVRRLSVKHGIPRHMIENMDIHSWPILEEMVYALSTKIASRTSEPLAVPKTWWDHVKLRFAPAWFLKRWPAERIIYVARAYYPEIEVPKKATFVEWEILHNAP